MAGDVRQFIRRSGVSVKYASAPAGGAAPTNLAAYSEIAHIEGNVTVNDQKNVVTVKEFSTQRSQFDLQYTDGRTGSIAIMLNLVPSDTGFTALRTDYQAGTLGYLMITANDEKATPNGLKFDYIVECSQFNVTLNQDNVATGSLNFVIQDVFTRPTT